MDRKGQSTWETLGKIVLVILILSIGIYLLGKGIGDGFVGGLSCKPATDQYQCVEKTAITKCPDGFHRDWIKWWGCPGEGVDDDHDYFCCVKEVKKKEKTGPGSDTREIIIPDIDVKMYELTAEFDENKDLTDDKLNKNVAVRDKTEQANHNTIRVLARQPTIVMVEAEVEDCENCEVLDHQWIFTAETKEGIQLLPEVADRIKVVVDKKSKKEVILATDSDSNKYPLDLTLEMLDPTTDEGQKLLNLEPEYGTWKQFTQNRNFVFWFPDEFNGETVKFTAKGYVEYQEPMPLPSGGMLCPSDELECGDTEQKVCGSDETTYANKCDACKKEVEWYVPTECKELPPSAFVEQPSKRIQDTVTLSFKIVPALRYGGLTQKWEQRKSITATCEDPIKCQNIYYRVIKNPKLDNPESTEKPQCPLPQLSDAKNAIRLHEDRDWCVYNELGKRAEDLCHDSMKACVEDGLASIEDSAFRVAFDIFMNTLQLNGGITAEDAQLVQLGIFWNSEQTRVSRRYCQPDKLAALDQFLLADRPNQNADLWTFTLDVPILQEELLCVYGQSATKEDQFYIAGDPQKIMIDLEKPQAQIKFEPLKLRLTFTCSDSRSGCEETMGTAYISQMESFFPALFKKGEVSAQNWCPPHETGTGYRPEVRNIVPYTDQALRVLCLRVEDRAGNSGVALVTVWNSYELLSAVLLKYLSESDRGQPVPTIYEAAEGYR